ncbi:MAG: T9SS type A sorting domain-containing protein [bacterium]|nr:T9SS type A sorting domain-containing protein [Candidatus Minthenecus merdequi]
MTDTISGDGDGRYDAGETIEWYPTIKNMYGNAQNIKFWVKFGFYNQGDWVDEDTTLYEILNDTAMFGLNLSSYAKNRSVNPARFKLSNDVADGRIMNATVFAVCDNIADTMVQTVEISVENGVEIGGMITEDLTLYPNVHYIVTQNLAVPAGVTLTIKPGTIIRFKDNTGLSLSSSYRDYEITIGQRAYFVKNSLDTANSARLIAKGTPDSMIVFTNAEGSAGIFKIVLGGVYPYVSHSRYSNDYYYMKDTLDKCESKYHCIEYAIFKNCVTSVSFNYFAIENGVVSNCLFTNNVSSISNHALMDKCVITNNSPVHQYDFTNMCNIINNNNVNVFRRIEDSYNLNASFIYSNNIFGNPSFGLTYYYYSVDVFYPEYPSYWGTAKESIARQQILDINTGYGFSHYDMSNMLTRPNPKAHGIVWKVVVDGWDAQDQFDSLPPIGVGTHACDVYFSRAMDTAVTPYVTFGVRAPYTQHSVNANGYWSADSTIYHTTFTIDGKTASDGLNRFYVADAKDNEHFEIPIENSRFNINIQATGSMSTGLMAEAGLGKVKLTWETDEEDFEDLLGYNIYRWTNDTITWDDQWGYNESGEWTIINPAGWKFDTTMVNTQLIDAQDTAFTDFNVTPGKPYYYIIKQMTTSLTNYSISNPVVATPLTAQKGDANGSLTVDVADVVTEVNYMMGGNPEPFIFEAADVNGDNVINVLDVVGTINLVMNPGATSSSVNCESVYYYIENGILYLQSDVVLGGVQLRLSGDSATTVITPQSALDEMEKIGMWQNSSTYFFMAYSMSGKSLLPGTYALLEIGDAEISEIVLSDVQGNNVAAIEKLPASLSTIECVQIMHCYPNPFRNEINIQYVVGRNDAHKVEFVMTDITGRTIATKSVSASYGGNTINWRLDNELMQGVYFVTLTVDGKKIQTEKVICQK